MEGLKLPKRMSFDGNVATTWKRWRQSFEIFMFASGGTAKPEETKVAILLHFIGKEALDIFNTFELSEDDKKNYSKVLEAFENYCLSQINENVARYIFFSRVQQKKESFNDFLKELKKLSITCGFGDLKDSLIKDRIIIGITDKHLKDRLLREGKLTLEKCVNMCKAAELLEQQLKMMNDDQKTEAVKFKQNWKSRDKEATTVQQKQGIVKPKISQELRFQGSYLNMSLEERRSQYLCQTGFVTLEHILPWSELYETVKSAQSSSVYPKTESMNKKVSLFDGDITTLEIDAIVNATDNRLSGGGGVDFAIHRAAGPKFQAECMTLDGCCTGEARITGGYRLPAKYVIHTVGPVGENTELLQNCYRSSLTVAKENGLRTIAFPCIATGAFYYPNERAAHVALNVVRIFLEQNESSFDRVIFCLFFPVDVAIYENLMKLYFPA